VVTGSLLLAACGGSSGVAGATSATPSGGSPSSSPSTSTTKPSGPAVVGRSPLTGLPVTDAALLRRGTVAVAVGLSSGQSISGLGSAELVYVQFDRPGHARLVALYQATDSTSVGPVDATNPADERLLTIFSSPAYGFDGGPMGFVAQAKAPSVTPRSAVGPYRSLYHAGSGGLFASTVRLRASAPSVVAPLAGAVTFASSAAPAPIGTPARHRIVVTVPGHAEMGWTWTSKGWAGPGGTFIENLVVQFVSYKALTPHKSPTVGSAQTVGSGTAVLYAGQHGLGVSWLRLYPGVVTVYKRGVQPVGLLPGRTWVLLVPAGTRVAAS